MENKERKIFDNVLHCVLIINIIFTFLYGMIKYNEIILFLNICSLFIIGFVILTPNNRFNIVTLVKCIFILLCVSSLYIIMFSKNYELKNTYWVVGISFISLFVINKAETISQEYRDNKLKEKKSRRKKLLKQLLGVLIIGLYISIFVNKFVYPQRQIIIEDIKVPESIALYKDRKDFKLEPNEIISFLNSSIKIQPNDIEKITSELKVLLETKQLENITGTDFFNYLRRIDNVQHYRMSFHNPLLDDEERILEKGYINQIIITHDRQVYIIENKSKPGLLFRNYYQEIYPVILSEEIVDLVLGYID
ncbi:hypothetical protein EDC19_0474 [Natranaerovirga hydrolytica]|uniref:Uncharacterized protein n=1 Tax=Natranaerovirga hydrolytica TaxID=680378 RepID=A0A4R1MXR3_9FIRM|nr:hypothetical protein [Natranaerovirga hydrolytica]TCK98057.1 hypothetical protein EDC19_0474 [Natranaerovirga hydrolytica]